MATDGELVSAWQAGNDRAGSELVGRYFDELCRFFANKVGDDADDLVQETFVSCLRNRNAYRGDCSFRTYILRIARSRLYDFLRKKMRSKVDDDLGVTSVAAMGLRISGQLALEEEKAQLLAALREISVDDQTIIELQYWSGLKMKEIAEVLEITVGAAKVRLMRAKERLRKQLEKSTRKSLPLEGLDRSLMAASRMATDGGA